MEKFALLDFLKAFGSLTAKKDAAPDAQPSPQQPPSPPTPTPDMPERNPMADVIARHEEIANRIKNRR